MKIVYISNSIIPSRTANSIHVMKMCQAFADNGHEVVLLAPDRYKEYETGVDDVFKHYGVRNNFKLIKVNYNYLKGIGGLIYGIKCQKYIDKFSPDLVYGRFTCGIGLSSLKYKSALELHSPIVGLSKIDRLFFNIFKNRISKIVLISEALKNIFINDKILKSKDNYIVAHDGADEVKDFSEKIDLRGDKSKLKVGYVGHLYKGKGIEVIEQVSHKLSDNIEIHIIGGLENDLNYWKNKIINKNIYFYGFIFQDKLYKYINALDVCLLPNQKIVLGHGDKDENKNISEFTSPLKMFEYMSFKKPIIASDLPVLKEVLNEKNSVLVDPEEPKYWLDAIEKLKDENYASIIALNAHKDFLSTYTWKQRARNIIDKIL